MKWFKHISDSYNDPDISDAWDLFGDSAIAIFWITLEIYAREFSHCDSDMFLSLSISFWERNLRRKWKEIEEIWNFFRGRNRFFYEISRGNLGGILNSPQIPPQLPPKTQKNHKKNIEKISKKSLEIVKIKIPKMIDLIDEYTRKKPESVRTLSGVTPDIVRSSVRTVSGIEVDIDKDKDKDKDSLSQTLSRPGRGKRAREKLGERENHRSIGITSVIAAGQSHARTSDRFLTSESIAASVAGGLQRAAPAAETLPGERLSAVAAGQPPNETLPHAILTSESIAAPVAGGLQRAAPAAETLPEDYGFEEFWLLYPKRRNREEARKAWIALHPDDQCQQQITQAIISACATHEWQRDDGRWIPLPARWLSTRGWEDELIPDLSIKNITAKAREGIEKTLSQQYQEYLAKQIPLTDHDILCASGVDADLITHSKYPEFWLAKEAAHIRRQRAQELGLPSFDEWKACPQGDRGV